MAAAINKGSISAFSSLPGVLMQHFCAENRHYVGVDVNN